ncbi:hypothetical protein CYMTET_16465 [Cymbomonas tetramitiformis]|uniref:Uncharacterized protein n=1 Tax=Cymbomonas tetramitiformis TaxID=36881 RepID=A0AAE0GDC5_9CHLO|nr:hypothetical protein CYMTET_16465 [Cymbomonas tetramitiformis]
MLMKTAPKHLAAILSMLLGASVKLEVAGFSGTSKKVLSALKPKPPGALQGWRVCAPAEGHSCSCRGTVYFGQKHLQRTHGVTTNLKQLKQLKHKTAIVEDQIECSANAFGADPAPALIKHCLCDEGVFDSTGKTSPISKDSLLTTGSRGSPRASGIGINPSNVGDCTITREDIQYTVNKLVNTPVVKHPYPYLFIQNIFSPRLYGCMLSKLPKNNKKYQSLQQGVKRFVITLANRLKKASGNLDQFWNEWLQAFGGEELKEAYLDKFQDTMSLRNIPKAYSGVKDYYRRTYWKTKLSRDMEGYEIGPHTDSNDKWVTVLYYLPKDDTLAKTGGTCVVRSKSGKVQLENSDWMNWSDTDFEVVFQAPFSPNSVFAFSPCYGSWHAVRKVNVSVQRDSIQSFIMGKDKIKKSHCPRYSAIT